MTNDLERERKRERQKERDRKREGKRDGKKESKIRWELSALNLNSSQAATL